MCPAMTPKCDVAADPNRCVECITDEDCGGLKATCETEAGVCVCVPSGEEICDGIDNDCNGELDEGFGAGEPCSAGVGACAANGVQVCDSPDSVTCDAVPGEPSDEVCDEVDNNCDGTVDEGFNPGCGCVSDADCGGPSSGQVCQPDVCIDGCRGTNGNGCPDGQMCTSDDETVGQCVPEEGTGGSDSASGGPTEGSASASASATDGSVTDGSASATDSNSGTDSDSNSGSGGALDDEGFGCECNSTGSGAPMGLALLGLLALGRRRRRA